MTETTQAEILTMADLRRANAAAGRYWFSPETLRFFNSKIETDLLAGRYFVTSERFDSTYPRTFTIRRASEDGSDIETIGKFQEWPTLASAKREIRLLQEEGK